MPVIGMQRIKIRLSRYLVLDCDHLSIRRSRCWVAQPHCFYCLNISYSVLSLLCVLLSLFLSFSRCSDFSFLLSFYHFPLSTSVFVVLHWFLTLRCPVDGFSHRIAFIVSSDSVAYSHPILNPTRLFSFSCYHRLNPSARYPIDIDRATPRRRTACRPQASFLCSFSLLDSEHQRITTPQDQHGPLHPPPRRRLRPPTHL